jgi:hypothetical protein
MGERTTHLLSFVTSQRSLRFLQALLLLITLGGAFAFCLQIAAWPDHPLADMTHLKWWTEIVGRQGLEHAYDGVYPESYVIYPPGMAYGFSAAYWLSQHVPPPAGRPAWLGAPRIPPADWLRVCIKLIAVAGHIGLALALFGLVTMAGGYGRGWAASALYAWSPAALFDVAYWGQADSLHSLGLVISLGVPFLVPAWWPLRRGGRWRLGAQLLAGTAGAISGAVLAAAGLTKPQVWVFLPLLLWILWRRCGPAGLATAAAAAGLTGWWIVQPWMRAGRVADMLSVFQNLTEVMPSVSANGHNLWWLKLPGVALAVLDWQPVGGVGQWEAPPLLTHATVGRLLFGLLSLLPLLRLTGPLSVELALTSAAYMAYAYFMAITQVHENHMFAVLPLLAGAALLDRWLILPFLVASVSVFGNLALHDFLTADPLAAWFIARSPPLPWSDPLALQTANAALNVAGFILFTVLFLRRPPAVRQTVGELRWRARFVLAAGLVLAGGALAALHAILSKPNLAGGFWDRLASRALASGPIEAKLGRHTPADQLLARAAVDYANLLYTLGAVAAIVASVAAAAGLWWLLCAWRSEYDLKRL